MLLSMAERRLAATWGTGSFNIQCCTKLSVDVKSLSGIYFSQAICSLFSILPACTVSGLTYILALVLGVH